MSTMLVKKFFNRAHHEAELGRGIYNCVIRIFSGTRLNIEAFFSV